MRTMARRIREADAADSRYRTERRAVAPARAPRAVRGRAGRDRGRTARVRRRPPLPRSISSPTAAARSAPLERHGCSVSTRWFTAATVSTIAVGCGARIELGERGVDATRQRVHGFDLGRLRHRLRRRKRDDPLHQVAESVREIAVRDLDEARLGEVGLADARHLAGAPPTQRVGAVRRRSSAAGSTAFPSDLPILRPPAVT